ncbi:MAG: GWxTD domain-containing protein [Bacteroidetes bacterium]|nr:GWxTD domain-containing protein [Bacteroidota bacterium]
MPISNAFKATSFSLSLALGLILEGCGASGQTENYSYQCFYDYAMSKSSLPEFEAALFYSPDTSGQRLVVYVSVKESRLRFERERGTYRASYSAVVRLVRNGGQPMVKETARTIVRSSYLESNENLYDAFFLPFDVEGGEYTVVISITDEASKQKATHTYRKTIPAPPSGAIALSDILLLARHDRSDQSMKITPFILANAGLLPDTMSLFTAAMTRTASTDSIFFSLYRLRGNSDRLPNADLQFRSSRQFPFDPCGEAKDTASVYSYWITADLDHGYSYVFGRVPRPAAGNYLLRVLAKDDRGDSAVSFLRFSVYNRDFPEVSDDIHEMVNSLNYIASSRELKEIVRVRADSAVKANLLNFWKGHGGYSKMVQYYQRVSQANRYFTNCVAGWRTPMGLFYIVCGPPDNVQCRAWNEWWTYTVSSQQGSMAVTFKLVTDSPDPERRVYELEAVQSNADLWSYYVNKWRTPF